VIKSVRGNAGRVGETQIAGGRGEKEVCGAGTIGCRHTEGVGGAVSDTGQRDGPNLILAIFLQKNGRPAS
jgi:hypothetical protein